MMKARGMPIMGISSNNKKAPMARRVMQIIVIPSKRLILPLLSFPKKKEILIVVIDKFVARWRYNPTP